MLEIFIVLFGCVFYGYKTINNNKKKRKDEKFNLERKRINDILRPSKNDIDEMEYILRDPVKRWELIDSIKEELMEIYGLSWKDELMNSSEGYDSWSIYEHPWGIAYNILLSKIGRVTNSSYSLIGSLRPYQRQRIVKMCQIIERNIQTIYPELKIVFIPNSTNEYVGELCWSHCIYNDTDTRSLW